LIEQLIAPGTVSPRRKKQQYMKIVNEQHEMHEMVVYLCYSINKYYNERANKDEKCYCYRYGAVQARLIIGVLLYSSFDVVAVIVIVIVIVIIVFACLLLLVVLLVLLVLLFFSSDVCLSIVTINSYYLATLARV
jgi:hypothetical protein